MPDNQKNRRKMGKKSLFPQGSLIEVKTDEEGFKDVYFIATVIPPPPRFKGNSSSRKYINKVYVEYQTLLAHDDGSDLLKEFVNVKFVRPAPPHKEIVEGFLPNDQVDAFYRDGWWIGVVKSVVEGGSRFVVTFQNPPDELEFGLSDLRVHWDWVDGLWVQQVHPSKAAMLFEAGRKVEVSFEEENCGNAWFPATMLEKLVDGSFQVELSRKSGDESQPLKASVDHLHIRPSPPCLEDEKFVLLDKVDAFIDFGWWSGVIVKELENGMYSIFIKQKHTLGSFHQSDVRTHMEWKDSKWLVPSEDVLILPLRDKKRAGSLGNGKENTEEKLPRPINSRDSKVEQSTSHDKEPSHISTSLAKHICHLASDSPDDLSLPLNKLKDGHLVDSRSLAPQQEHLVETPVKAMRSGSASPTSENARTSSVAQPVPGDLSSNNLNIGQRNRIQQRVEQDNSRSTSMNKKGRTREAKVESSVSVGGSTTEKGSSKDNLPLGEKSSKLGSDLGHQSNDSVTQRIKGNKEPVIEERICKRQRGTMKKQYVKSQERTGSVQNVVVTRDEMVIRDCVIKVVGLCSPTEVVMTGSESSLYDKESTMRDWNVINALPKKRRSGSMLKRTQMKVSDSGAGEKTQTKVSGSGAGEGLINLNEKQSLKGGRKPTTDEKVKDSLGIYRRQIAESRHEVNVEKVIPEVPSKEFDNEPLSKWIEEMQTPIAVNGSTGVTPVSTATNDTERQSQSGLPTSTFGNTGFKFVQGEQHGLPFVKNKMLWGTVESMEVFQRMPQKPHFKPLEHVKESSREGLAIGFMVTFSSVVEKASCLQLNDPKSISDDILDTLVHLERYGFDVQAVRDRITGLLLIKDRKERLNGQVDELCSQIALHNLERNHLNKEIDEINKQLRILQEKLFLVQAAKETEDRAVFSWASKLQELKENIRIIEIDFEGLAATPL